jgi:hypothetical protein
MYGAYMYGKRSEDADALNVDAEKRSMHLQCEFN